MARTTITNRHLLQHMQGMKSEIITRIENLETRVETMNIKMNDGFKEARQHREALQEDLDASIHMLGRHDKKLARL